MVRSGKVGCFALGALMMFAAHVSAQTLPTGIAGVVKDSSGAVMPGVTVEASSDVLIEKVRTAVSDEHGEYKITDLRPGTYSVTFSLTGFSTIKRENIELTSGFTAKVDADMRVGALEETLTVTGQSPVVDVQNTSQTKVVSNEMLFALPLTKEMGGLAKVTVGVMVPPTAQDVGGNMDPMNAYPAIHGGHAGDNRALLDGMQFNGEGAGRGFYFNPSAATEASVQLGGQTAEFENSGFQASMVPREGGNRYSGIFGGNYAGKGLVADNLSDYIQQRGLTLVNKTNRTYDANAAAGGPLIKDKLWFFTAHRVFGYQNILADDFWNLTHNTPIY